MTRLRSRIESLVVAALVGWWSPLLGLLVICAIWRYLGWWSIPLVFGGGVWERLRWTDGAGRWR